MSIEDLERDAKRLAIKTLEKDASKLATELMGNSVPCRNEKCVPSDSCISIEEHRTLTKAERSQGWSRRPFYAYDHRRMCSACAAYWHASMTHICLVEFQKGKFHG